jgi:hypothetical protein
MWQRLPSLGPSPACLGWQHCFTFSGKVFPFYLIIIDILKHHCLSALVGLAAPFFRQFLKTFNISVS